jgi:hypothetical protein
MMTFAVKWHDDTEWSGVSLDVVCSSAPHTLDSPQTSRVFN